MNKFEFALNLMEGCKGVEQGCDNHPEGDVFIHTLQSLGHALRESQDRDLILAMILHDIGKKTDSLGHENHAIEFLRPYKLYSEKVLWLIEHHLRVRWLLDGVMRKRKKVEYLIEHRWFADLCRIARWDKMGRKAGYVPKYNRAELLERLEKL